MVKWPLKLQTLKKGDGLRNINRWSGPAALEWFIWAEVSDKRRLTITPESTNF